MEASAISLIFRPVDGSKTSISWPEVVVTHLPSISSAGSRCKSFATAALYGG
jgi:hypothetical protein